MTQIENFKNLPKLAPKRSQILDAEKAYFAAQKELILGHFCPPKRDQILGEKLAKFGAQKHAKIGSKT